MLLRVILIDDAKYLRFPIFSLSFRWCSISIRKGWSRRRSSGSWTSRCPTSGWSWLPRPERTSSSAIERSGSWGGCCKLFIVSLLVHSKVCLNLTLIKMVNQHQNSHIYRRSILDLNSSCSKFPGMSSLLKRTKRGCEVPTRLLRSWRNWRTSKFYLSSMLIGSQVETLGILCSKEWTSNDGHFHRSIWKLHRYF